MAEYDKIFKVIHNNILPTKGSVIISEPFLSDFYFQRSVVFLIDHSKIGSMGFVLNKQSKYKLNNFVGELRDCRDIPLYIGGPVSSSNLFFLHTLDESIISGSMKINDTYYFGGSFEDVKQYMQSGAPFEKHFKFFLGYSGWTKGQLNDEIRQNSWIVNNHPTDILQAEDENYWKSSIAQLGKEYKNWTMCPKIPILN